MRPARCSPVHAQIASLRPQWDERNGMPTASNVGNDDLAKLDTVALADVSFLPRTGLKGPAAEQWLAVRKIPVPEQANGWALLPAGGVICRLGRTEYFLEDSPGGSSVAAIRTALGRGTTGVYEVIRQDAAFALAGKLVNELLVQTCNVNFAQFSAHDKTAVMTSMAGVSILALRTDSGEVPCYRIWCDPTYAAYLWETLAQIAEELGGGVIGTQCLPNLDHQATPSVQP